MLRNPVSSLKYLQPWLIVACGMVFYCFNYFMRVSPGVMQSELTNAFHITATEYGALAAFYYYAYTAMQVPAGMIYDKFNIRLILCGACLTAIIGLAVFASASSYPGAALGRFLIGLGCAFAYIGTLKLASIWLPPTRFGLIAGLTTAIGMVSGALSQKYLSHFVATIGYQAALKSALVLGIILVLVMFGIIRNKPNKHHVFHPPMDMNASISNKQMWQTLRIIFMNPQMWLIGIIGCLIYLPSSVFLDLWGIPYLQAVYHLSTQQAVAISGYTFYGWILAGPILGALSDKIKRRRLPLAGTGIFAAILLCVVFYIPGLNVDYIGPIFFLIGFCCGGHSLVFALGKENNPLPISGTAVAATNMLIMLGGVIFQPIVGTLIDLHANHTLTGTNGLPLYTAGDYTFALSVVPIGVAIGVFLCLFLRETYCESQASQEQEQIFAEDLPSLATAEIAKAEVSR